MLYFSLTKFIHGFTLMWSFWDLEHCWCAQCHPRLQGGLNVEILESSSPCNKFQKPKKSVELVYALNSQLILGVLYGSSLSLEIGTWVINFRDILLCDFCSIVKNIPFKSNNSSSKLLMAWFLVLGFLLQGSRFYHSTLWCALVITVEFYLFSNNFIINREDYNNIFF